MLDSDPRTVTSSALLTLDLGDEESAQVLAEFRYDPSDPLAVTLAIGCDLDEPILWVFARDLLATGVTRPSGDGDVHVAPVRDHGRPRVELTLRNDAVAVMTVAHAEVIDFLVRTYAIVPTGCEVDESRIDAELALLLA